MASSQAGPGTFPKLEILPRGGNPHWTFLRPAKRIESGGDVERFLTSRAYRDIGIFVLQLNRALCPRKLPTGTKTFTLSTPRNDPESVKRLQGLLTRIEAITDEAPPDKGPRRFGNVAFRKWYSLLDERVDGLLKEFLPAGLLKFGGAGGSSEEKGPLVELRAYFLGGFGSSQRLDYGTGHELSFVAFLGCLWKLGAFEGGNSGETSPGEIERSIVLGVLEPYLKVVRRLILTYTLEPAGSHGVWGLDDHSFMPYIFGSAQLTRPITETEAMPLEGSCPGAPKPADIVKAAAVAAHRDDNMYFSAVGFINDVKKGPFWEHSPILFDVSGIKDGWGKINKGMVKMFNAEVLSKFPVVQHFPFGSLFSWDTDPNAVNVPVVRSVHMTNQPIASGVSGSSGSGGVGISAASTSRPMAAPPIAAPWARTGFPPSEVAAPPVPTEFPKGTPGMANNQFAVTKAPWAKN
ncbi:serine/threonine-protein phosphatase 2A activator 1 [Apodospora peruviana]|uniref:Serine/threonine-protein phosphatase 2A activator n=1 Tax=Apodospora peruviana TaxID=516989 RepID=A0AAE0M2A4_9PEZI|nr:serine/threonine-protein phosphatase 2A activator 1 [Apodospora peruviana]